MLACVPKGANLLANFQHRLQVCAQTFTLPSQICIQTFNLVLQVCMQTFSPASQVCTQTFNPTFRITLKLGYIFTLKITELGKK